MHAAAVKRGKDDEEDDDALVSAEELLLPEDRVRPAAVAMADCGTGVVKKACKNCTCGMAELEDNASNVVRAPQPGTLC
jgi:hypothetical protein